MRCAILALTENQGERLRNWVEDQGEDWQGAVYLEAQAAYQALCARYHQAVILCPCPEAEALAVRLQTRPPLAAPWVIGPGQALPRGVPPGAMQRLGQVTCLSRALLRALTVPFGLRAWDFLPDMLALTVVHPPLLDDLRGRLYPLLANRHGISCAAIERSLRTLVEATWTRGDLAALERFFGSSVDPDRGKPTNKEFLFQLQERVTIAARRLI